MTNTNTRGLTLSLLLILGVGLLALPGFASCDTDMTYEEAVQKMIHLAEKIDQVAEKTRAQVLKANHWHKMLKEAEMADKAIVRILRQADKLIQEAAKHGITFTCFDIEVFNQAVGRWVRFDPIHIMSSGD